MMTRQSGEIEHQLPLVLAVKLWWLGSDRESVPEWLQNVVRDHMYSSDIATRHSLKFSSIQPIDEDAGEYEVSVFFEPTSVFKNADKQTQQRGLLFLEHSVEHFSRQGSAVAKDYYDLSVGERMVYLANSNASSRWVLSHHVSQPPLTHGVGRLVRVEPGYRPLAPHHPLRAAME